MRIAVACYGVVRETLKRNAPPDRSSECGTTVHPSASRVFGVVHDAQTFIQRVGHTGFVERLVEGVLERVSTQVFRFDLRIPSMIPLKFSRYRRSSWS